MSYQAKAAQYKKDNVARVVELLEKYPVVGLVNVENLPAAQLSNMRSKMRSEATIFLTKKTFLLRAFEQVKGKKAGLEQLESHITGMPALLLSESDPFKIAQLIRKSKSSAPAKPGQVSPKDIVIPAGPTSFAPGPIISELGAAGLKTGVENGKIAIKEDKKVVSEGQVISAPLASLLAKFQIEPMEIGLDLVAAFQDGIVYSKKVLSVDPQEYLNMLTQAASESNALSLEIGYVTKDNIKQVLAKAFTAAKHLALEKELISDELLKKQIGMAELAAEAISSKIPAPEATAEPKAEETKE